MASQYQRVYARVSGGEQLDGKRLGLLYKQKPYVPATAFIRCILPWRSAMSGTPHDVRAVDAQWLLAGGLEHVDALVIQRDAVPLALVDDLLARLHQRRIPYCYEIDDPLWDLPAGHADHAIYAPQRDGIVRLIQEADVTTTSTPAMMQQLQTLTPRVELVGTTLDPTLWRAPLDPGWILQVLGAAGLEAKRPRILYMGTSSHAADLRMVLPAIEAVMAVDPALEFVQVGAGEALPGAKLLAVPEDCGPYPQFVRWFRAVCSAATIAVAPLQDNAFNAAKSDIKALDYALGGLPAVFSAVGPYKASIKHGRSGLLVDNDIASWTMAITRLLDDAGLRDAIRAGSSAWARDRDDRTEDQFRRIAAATFGWKVHS
jgi:glycosyltransferase involved in cell wall biosynthesis